MINQYPLNETALISQLRHSDRKAFALIYERYWEKLYVAACHRLRTREIAQELVQEVFTNLWLRREELSIRKDLGAYLYSALKYEMLDHLRSVAVRERYAKEYRKVTGLYPHATQRQLPFDELHAQMKKEIGKLPGKCRLVFTLSRLEYYSHKEIGEQLNITPKTVEAHMSRALKTLRISLKDFLPLLLFVLH